MPPRCRRWAISRLCQESKSALSVPWRWSPSSLARRATVPYIIESNGDRDAGSDRLRHAPSRWNHPVGGLPGRAGSSARGSRSFTSTRGRIKTPTIRRSPFSARDSARGRARTRTRNVTRNSSRPRSSRRWRPRCSSPRQPQRMRRFRRIVPRSSRRDSTWTTPCPGADPGPHGQRARQARQPRSLGRGYTPGRDQPGSSDLRPLLDSVVRTAAGAAVRRAWGLSVAAVPSGVAPATPSIDSLAAAAMNPVGDPPGQDGGGFAGNGGNSGGKSGGRGRHGGRA